MYYLKRFNVGNYSAYHTWAMYDWQEGTLLGVCFFDRSKQLCRAMKAQISIGTAACVGWKKYRTKGIKYSAVYKPIFMKRDRFTLCTILSQEVGTRYVVTSYEDQYEDIYNFLMWNSKLPLLREWTEPLVDELRNEGKVRVLNNAVSTTNDTVGIDVHGKVLTAETVIVYDLCGVNEQSLEEAVTGLIRRGQIKVADVPSKPLEFEDFNGYVTKYGPALVKSLDKVTNPLMPLKGDLDGFAALNKRLFPQQAACVNGIIALKKAGSKYGLMIEGMGCGKTVQGASVVDAYFNQKWLERHPGMELKDIYLAKEDAPVYRNIVMAPSHLVNKWKEEIESEIPGAKAIKIESFDQLLDIKAAGKERTGREWYLISKDRAKLGSQSSPIPVNVAKKYPTGIVCKDCYDDDGSVVYMKKDKQGRDFCPKCNGHHSKRMTMYFRGEQRGLTCPDCGSLLLKYSASCFDDDGEDHGGDVLTPKDFASHNSKNDKCVICGAHLWGVDVKPILPAGKEPKEKKWKKISHWKNFQKRNRATAWVLKGHEDDYYKSLTTDLSDIQYSKVEWGPRRYAPAQFIKKHLNGFFDFAVLDECHKYENGGTAQGVAAHALMKASDFTLALTGTISNGKADSLFYLLYMLDPRRMKKLGFDYTDVLSFSRVYGAIEQLYEAGYEEDGARNSQSRGRKIGSPRVKPGISPKLFTDFLLDKAVFLDLSDLSKYLPQLKEQVVTCELPTEVGKAYEMVLNNLKDASRKKGGRALLSTMLQFGLSYPDKPYGRGPIMHPLYKDDMVSGVPACEEYRDGALLPKEEKLCEIVRSEISEDRNVFVYCAYTTGSGEMSVLDRLRGIVERECNLTGQVLVMEASSPKAEEREAYIHQKAAEGYRVIICNMKLVETGLDFCFMHEGADYNYPSIVFYQLTYELSVMWQASRRHYRLNQKQECRTFYLATEGTLQMAAVQIMAEKQVAASAIQGKFSADGLAAMANGVDPRIKLAQMLASNDNGEGRESIENMFDVMNASNAGTDDEERYGSYVPPKTYWEIMDGYLDNVAKKKATVVVTTKEEPKKAKPKAAKPKVAAEQQVSIFDLLEDIGPVVVNNDLLEMEEAAKPKKSKKARPPVEGQLDLFAMFAA